jgi:hypothetical protein
MKIPSLVLFTALAFQVSADDLDNALESVAPADAPVMATFKSLRLVQSQSVETTQKGVLNFTISHRFGPFGSGPENFMGMDFARIRLGLDYGITDRLDVGFERSNNEGKPLDLFVKARVLRQTTSGSMPLSVTWYSAGYMMTDAGNGLPYNLTFERRLSSTHQIIVARKFNENLSLQVSPTLVTRQLRPFEADKEVSAGVMMGGRYKLTQRFALTAEAAPMFYGTSSNWDPAMAAGVDIETGGHVFQLYLSNSAYLSEDRMYSQTKGGPDGPIDGGSVALGFNITRGFSL